MRRLTAPRRPSALPTAKIGLCVFLAVVDSLFALFVSAYCHAHAARRTGARLPMPPHPVAQHRRCWSRAASRSNGPGARRGRDDMRRGQAGLLAAACAALAFLAGQLMAWRQLGDAGYGLTGNPADTLLLSAHRLARPACARRPRRRWAHDRHALAQPRHRDGCAWRRALRPLLAFPACWCGWCCSLLLAG